MAIINIKKTDSWINKILSYPNIDEKTLTLRKSYWIASVACFAVIAMLTGTVWYLFPHLKILLSYGFVLIILYAEFILAGILIRRNLYWLMFFNQVASLIITFIYILLLGGILHSGGLVFIGLFTVLFSLDFKNNKLSIILFIIYFLTVIAAGVLNPYLTKQPEIPQGLNIALFVINLSWISFFALLFILNIISQRVGFEKKEATRLKELDEVKSKLYSNITHEFRTPLTIILGMADLIKENPKEWLIEGINKIENSSKLLLHHVNQMLDLSKLEANAMPINLIQADIIQYLKYLVGLFHSMAACKNIQLSFYSEVKNLFLDFDSDKLLKALSNLISNAIKYTQEGGFIKMAAIIDKDHATELIILVKDNGPGIPEDKLPFIFDRFYRVENAENQSIEGTGLGLAVTKHLVKLLNGKIQVRSSVGEGTEFILKLPITNNAKKIAIETNTDVDLKILNHIKLPAKNYISANKGEAINVDKPLLLVVEDSIDVINYIQALLFKDYNIQTANDGKEGMKKAFELIPDIIISDVMMPEMDGISLLEKLKGDHRTSHIPIILLTAKADVASRLTGLKKGADAYLSKPFNKDELIIELKKLLELRRIMQERYSEINYSLVEKNNHLHLEDEFIKKIKLEMEANLSYGSLNIEALCHVVAMSRAQLYRKFKSLTNKTLGEYFRTYRLSKAHELLQNNKHNVSEAAYQTGFKNLSHFSRVFTDEFGVNPSDLQK